MSVHCPHCGQHFRRDDVTVTTHIRRNIITGGSLVVAGRGRVDVARVVCSDLVTFGSVSGNVRVLGAAEFYGAGESLGELHCGHFILHTGATRVFRQRIYAESAEIRGELTADLCCLGRLHIHPGGAINGSVLAGQLSIDPGGQINGQAGSLSREALASARLSPVAAELAATFDLIGPPA